MIFEIGRAQAFWSRHFGIRASGRCSSLISPSIAFPYAIESFLSWSPRWNFEFFICDDFHVENPIELYLNWAEQGWCYISRHFEVLNLSESFSIDKTMLQTSGELGSNKGYGSTNLAPFTKGNDAITLTKILKTYLEILYSSHPKTFGGSKQSW